MHGDSSVQRLLVPLHSKEDIYKLSQYVVKANTEDGLVMGNTLTGEIIILSPEEEAAINNLPLKNRNNLLQLIAQSYVVPESCDELKRFSQLRAIMLKRHEREGVFVKYNVLPTTFCNARCFYCYENGIRQVNMSEETAEELVEFIDAHRSNRTIELSWFGGEPTLGIQRIDQICNRLKEKNIDYTSCMVSNAYLFNENLVEHAKVDWHLREIQVTLDGTADVYNKTKSYVYNDINPFQRVLRNIDLLLEEEINVVIRLNLDEHNADDLDTLIDELIARFKERKKLTVYVRQLSEDVGYNPIVHNADDMIRLRKRLSELQNKLEQVGWKQIRHFAFPKLSAWSCMADNPYVIQCTPDGILSKCEDKIYDHSVGTLAEGIVDINTREWWKQQEYYDDCKECLLLPSCTHVLKNCPTKIYGCPTEEREYRINLCKEAILEAHEKWIKNGRK